MTEKEGMVVLDIFPLEIKQFDVYNDLRNATFYDVI